MNSFSLWQRWLFYISIFIAAYGLSLALFNQTSSFNLLLNDRINPVFFNSIKVDQQVNLFQKWIYGVLGATVFGWGIFLSFIAHSPFKRKEKWAWNCFLTGIICWFVVDTSISFYFTVVFNAIFNIVLFIGILIPLLFSRKYFNNKF